MFVDCPPDQPTLAGIGGLVEVGQFTQLFGGELAAIRIIFCESSWMKPVAFHISTLDVVTHALKSSGHKCRSRAEYDLLLEKIAALRGFLQGCAEHEREVLDSINWRRRP
jgi:hypothetical protein